MSNEHLSSQYENDLKRVSTRVMDMGKLVENQFRLAIEALSTLSTSLAARTADSEAEAEAEDPTNVQTEALSARSMHLSAKVIETEAQVNAMEIQIDRDLAGIIALRQPTARDLRLLIAISKTTTDLERVGDEAKKIAHKVQALRDTQHASMTLPAAELRIASELALQQLRESVAAFHEQDTSVALSILKEDDILNHEFFAFMRTLITYMMEDPRTISASLELLFVAKAIERIGDHAKNIAEFIIYIVEGTDVRHTTMAQIEAAMT